MGHEPAHQMLDAESHVKRNPHGDFKAIEASRPAFNHSREFDYSQVPNPAWKLGDGANDGGESLKKKHVEIDPYAEGRPAVFNYKLMISAIIPRPIGFVSTYSKDGTSTNLAPFSYTQMVNHDPPVFVIGFASSSAQAKDSLRNLIDTGECTINIISEHFIEAANATAINAPYGVSEWSLTGLHPEKCTHVKASRVKESIFSVEGKLMDTKEFQSRSTPGKTTGTLAIVEGVNFWAREDAVNEDKNLIDPNILRPVSRLGGITYARTLEGMETPRPDYMKKLGEDGDQLVKPKAEGQ